MRKSASRPGERTKGGAQKRESNGQARRGVKESTLATLQSVGQRGREAAGTLRGRLPSGEAVRAGAVGMRTWSAQMAHEHPVRTGLGAMALGFAAAALFPASRVERRAFTHAAGQVRDLADRFEVPRRYDEVLEAVRQAVAKVVAEQLTSRVLDVGGATARHREAAATQ